MDLRLTECIYVCMCEYQTLVTMDSIIYVKCLTLGVERTSNASAYLRQNSDEGVNHAL